MMSKRHWLLIISPLVIGIPALLLFILGLHRKPNFIQNFEEEEYGRERPFIDPVSVANGLAIYSVGTGEPLLLFPYPHGHTKEPMAQGPIAKIIASLGRSVISFDVPGAYRSTRVPLGDMAEMVNAADETLERLAIAGPVDVVGHSMGGLVALAYAIERPQRVQRLVLVNSVSGFPAAARWGYPGSVFKPYEADYWRLIIWGMRLNSGRANLALHKKLYNLMGSNSYHDQSLFIPLAINEGDDEKGVPVRMIWSQNMLRRLSYAQRLAEVQAPTLILAGRHDPETPIPCSTELQQGIASSSLVIFEKSGHSPFVEEKSRFAAVLDSFLAKRESP